MYTMAKVLLISLYDTNAEGLRTLSSILRVEGHEPYIIFLKRYSVRTLKRAEDEGDNWIGIDLRGRPFKHARGTAISKKEFSLLDQLIRHINADVAGFSLTAPLKQLGADLTRFIKRNFGIPVIWGGAEPTLNPDSCANHCDLVCIGEGEKAIVEIADRLDAGERLDLAPNMAYAENGRLIRNPMSPLVLDLDSIPFKDFFPDNKFLIEDGRLVDSFSEISYSRNRKYHIQSSRGCPFACSYCSESRYHKLYASQAYLRRRSPSHVIGELKAVQEFVDYQWVQFEDEIFTQDSVWLEEFSLMYRKEIRRPFICYLFPDKNIERNLTILKKAGLSLTCLGLQSGSARTNRDIYQRPFDRNLLIRTADKLHSLHIDYYVDLITHNPLETEEDLRATLAVLTALPKPFWLCVNKLHILEGTALASIMKKKGCSGEVTKNLARLCDFYARLFWLTPFSSFHRHTIRLLQKLPIFRKYPRFINPFLLNLPLYLLFLAKKGLKRIEPNPGPRRASSWP